MLTIFFVVILSSVLIPVSHGNSCSSNEVFCDGKCAEACDGFAECHNREDETYELCNAEKCSEGVNLTEGNFDDIPSILDDAIGQAQAEFKCDYGACIPVSFKCNGLANCWDKSDETAALCSSNRCKKRDFQCAYGACIKRLFTCNGINNCADGSDETAEVCKDKRCFSSKFQCKYGGCIDKRKRCDGKINCHDGSDESKEECGQDHQIETTPPPVATPPPVVTQPPPPPPVVTQPPPPPPVVTQPPPPVTSSVFVPNVTIQPFNCESQGKCSCSPPFEHFCVPCNQIASCDRIREVGVCSIEPLGGPEARISVDVLSCGVQPVINVLGFVRKDGGEVCGTGKAVPVQSVVTANCWGTTTLAQCRADGMWHQYGGTDDSPLPSARLCQHQDVNSPICGYRPAYFSRHIQFGRKPEWPWLAGLMRDNRYACTATIISPRHLLTAAHCLTKTQVTSNETVDLRDLRIQRVNHAGSIIREYVSKIYLYPGYKGGTRPNNDLALVQVEREIVFSHQVYPACISTQTFPRNRPAATFSPNSNEYLWELILQQYDPRCHSPHDRCSSFLEINNNQFCGIDTASKKFLPKGSSGGPYLVNLGNDAQEQWSVAGVVSSRRSELNCSHPFTVFTAIFEFWSWIYKCVHNGECV